VAILAANFGHFARQSQGRISRVQFAGGRQAQTGFDHAQTGSNCRGVVTADTWISLRFANLAAHDDPGTVAGEHQRSRYQR
jgi:hypothetical protein